MNSKPSMLSKLDTVLPELFKMIPVSELSGNTKNFQTVSLLKDITLQSQRLPSTFKNAATPLDSSGHDFDNVNKYRNETLNKLIDVLVGVNINYQAADLIEQLRTDMPSKTNK
jgi:hypothetical protein